MRHLSALVLTASMALAAAVLPAQAFAEDRSWRLVDVPDFSSVAKGSLTQVVWSDSDACDDAGAISYRVRTPGGWGPIRQVQRCIENLTLSDPTVMRDPRSGGTFIVWSQTNFTNRKLSGIYYTRVLGTARFSKPIRLVATPQAVVPAPVTAAARSKRLWVMWQNSTKIGSRQARFRLQSFRQQGGGVASKNIAVGSARFKADTTPGSMKLYSARLGIVALWQLTDAGGDRNWYAADSTRLPDSTRQSGKRYALEYSGKTEGEDAFYATGEDNRLYRVVEKRSSTEDGKQITSFIADRWEFAGNRFVPAVGSNGTVVSFEGGVALGSAFVGFGVDPQRNVYVAYQNPSVLGRQSSSCTTEQGLTCVRQTAPSASPATVFVARANPAGQQTQAAVPWTIAAAAPVGSTVIEWVQPQTGIERVTTAYGGVRLMDVLGSQIVEDVGAIDSEIRRDVVLSDPLIFR